MKRFPTLQSDIAAASTEALERFRDDSRKTVTRLVEMESSYLTVEFFRKLNMEGDRNQNQTGPNADKNKKEPAPNMDMYGDNYLRRIGMQVSPHFAYTTKQIILALVSSSSFIYSFNYYFYYFMLTHSLDATCTKQICSMLLSIIKMGFRNDEIYM